MRPKINDQELARLADARDWRGLAALLAPCGQALPDPDRLYRGMGLDDSDLDALLSNLVAGRGVPSREDYSPEKLADFAITDTLAHGAKWGSVAHGIEAVRQLFKGRTPEVEVALSRLDSALLAVKSLFRAEVTARLEGEPEIEQRLFERLAKSYLLGDVHPYLQSAARGGADAAGAGCALFFAVTRGLKRGRHSVVVEFERQTSDVLEVGVYPDGIQEVVVLGDIPGPAVQAVWIDGRRLTLQELAQFVE